MIHVAQVQATQDDAHVDIPFVGDSIIHRMRVHSVIGDAVNRGSSGATGNLVCQMVRQVSEFQARRAALVHIGTNDATDIMSGLATLAQWRNRVNCILAYATVPLVWAGIHYTGVARKNTIIDQLNEIAEAACEERDQAHPELPCVFVPSNLGERFNPALFGDSTHPNAQGYAVWIPAIRAGFADLGIAP